jgi:Zn-dependent peptidase ImmA (M78 family)/transcriptional regulator with XRE-family HTH domain
MASLPVTVDVLRWAIDQAGMSSEQFAAAVGEDSSEVEGWLNGDDKPNKGQLERTAKALHRPPQVFFLPAPPTAEDFPVRRRSAIGGSTDADGSELAAFRRANRVQGLSKWILESTTSSEERTAARVAFPPVDSSPETFSAQMRSWLEWDTVKQVKQTSKAAVFNLLRAALEDAGIVTLLSNYGKEAGQGFSLPDADAPLIFVNSAYDLSSVRTYTLLHELAHLARGDSSLHHGANLRIERYCERFAAAFLMPSKHLASYLSKGVVAKYDKNDPERVRLVSNRYRCSWKSAELRLIELGFADKSLSLKMGNEVKEGGGPGAEPQTTDIRRIAEFGTNFARLVKEARDQNLIAQLDAMRYLRVNSDQLASVFTRATVG